MGEMKVKFSDETEAAFRKSAMETFGYSKGALSNAAEEAAKEWIAARLQKVEKTESLANFVGVLKHVKKTSVELQHETGETRRARYYAHRR